MTNRSRVPAILLSVVLCTPLLALEIGRESAVTPPSIEPAPGQRYAPKVASNGDGFLVVWYDRRGGASEVRATRLGADGTVLDPESILVASGTGTAVSVASNGDDYLVSFSCGESSTPWVCLSRVDAGSGEALRAAAIGGMSGALASTGDGYFLVYQTGSAGSAQPVMGVSLGDDGSVAGTPFPITASAFAPAVASNGDAYLVVWSTYVHLEGRLVSESGVLGSQQRLTEAEPSWGPGPFAWSVGSSGPEFLVAWQQNTGVADNAYTTELRVRGVSAVGVAGTSRQVAGAGAWQPSLARTGSGYVLVYTYSTSSASAPYLQWSADGDIRALPLTPAGEPAGEPSAQAATAGRETAATAAFNGSATLMAWENIQHPGSALIEVRELGKPDTLAVSTSVAWQQNVAISRDSVRTLIAFEETAGREQLSRVVLHQYEVNTGGQALGRETFTLAPSPRHQLRPAFGYNMLAWVEEEPGGKSASVWWDGLSDHLLGSDYRPSGHAETVEAALPGTRIHVLNEHVFHVILWTAPDGRLKGVRKQLVTRLGFDPATFYVTSDAAINPSSDGYTPSIDGGALIAYNHPIVPEVCGAPCIPQFSIRATTLGGMAPQKSIDIAPVGASAPRVVDVGGDHLVFWSMEEGGTWVQRVTTSTQGPAAIGDPIKVHEGSFHDASAAPGGQVFVAVTEGDRFALLRLDAQLNIIESTPFAARPAGDSTVRLSGNVWLGPMMAYATPRPNDGASSRAVFRLIGDDVAPQKRRTVR